MVLFSWQYSLSVSLCNVNSKSAVSSPKTEFATMFCLRGLWRGGDDPITIFSLTLLHFCHQYLLFVSCIFQCTGNIRTLFKNPLFPFFARRGSGIQEAL